VGNSLGRLGNRLGKRLGKSMEMGWEIGLYGCWEIACVIGWEMKREIVGGLHHKSKSDDRLGNMLGRKR
jgi:hypothetical protein